VPPQLPPPQPQPQPSLTARPPALPNDSNVQTSNTENEMFFFASTPVNVNLFVLIFVVVLLVNYMVLGMKPAGEKSSHLFKDSPSPPPPAAAEANADGVLLNPKDLSGPAPPLQNTA
jgi:hypothetical protein